jgi:hypothetical protein
MAERPIALPPVMVGRGAMLQNLSREIRECLLLAEQSKRMAETALTSAAREELSRYGAALAVPGSQL